VYGVPTKLVGNCNPNYKKGGQVGIAMLYSRLQVGHCNGYGVLKFEFNDYIILLAEPVHLDAR